MRPYYHPFSSNARRAVITAIELAAPVELVLVDLPKREHRQPAFLARNPAGRVPVLGSHSGSLAAAIFYDHHPGYWGCLGDLPDRELDPRPQCARANVGVPSGSWKIPQTLQHGY